jgi:proteic killer suppression protein
MIRSFADDSTRDVWHGVNSKAARRIPKALWPVVRRKLDQIDAVTKLDVVRVPPGNRLHALGADRAGYHAVRINDQYRIVFRFDGGHAYDVSCADYH